MIAISIGQFRPEKDHNLQILAFSIMIKNHPELSNAKLFLVGSCRGKEDSDRVDKLMSTAKELKISENVEFHVNVNYSSLMELLNRAKIGLHSMWNEHFGICVVELMASGLITIAHNSAGPKLDIIDNEKNGFLATTPEEYAEIMSKVFSGYPNYLDVRKNARKKAEKFSDEIFKESIQSELSEYLK